MKVIGLIGGMSWESTAEYYRIINEEIKERLGGFHSARILLYSVDFHQVEALQQEGRWQEATKILLDAARRVQRGGADFVLICTNTMHKVVPEVEAAISIPLLHIADTTASEISKRCISRIALLGTKYTMEDDFYKGRLVRQYGLEVMIPPETERHTVHGVIYDELCVGNIVAGSRTELVRIIGDLGTRGAEGVILGCTELSLLIKEEDSPLPLFDTTAIHARSAVDFALRH